MRLKDVPNCDSEAPCPAVVADEGLAHLAFYSDDEEDITVIVTFWGCAALRFGAGGGKLDAQELTDSKWLHARRAAAVEASPEAVRALKNLHHYSFTFPAWSFECLADGYTVKTRPGHTPLKSASDLAQDMRGV
ncbi:MAG: hypothetical protein HYZ75_15825 [Elusimicrobia bacterium]|nr:hypothetical protein [Elusimicrobiota bacterium]